LTPDCSLCGLVVEYVRSSYRGQWRLFRNRPDVLTRGRYVFVPYGTAHYEGFHHYWSSNWTRDRESFLGPSDLGEVSSPPRVYDKGDLPFPPPPATTVAEPGCISGGDVYPPANPRRWMLEGFPADCWTGRGVAVPMRQPALWFKPEAIPDVPDGSPFPIWQDGGTAGLDLVATPFPPLVATPEKMAWKAAAQSAGSLLLLPAPVPLGRDFETFGVFVPVAGGLLLATPRLFDLGAGGLLAPSFGLVPTLMYADSVNQFDVPIPATDRQLTRWRVKRETARVRMWLNGDLVADQVVNPLGEGSVLGLAQLTGLGTVAQWLEVLVYTPGLLPWESPGVLAYLDRRYGET